MGTVTLGDGRKITVGAEFAKLSPEEQQSWVNEVAAAYPATEAAPAAPSVPISDRQFDPNLRRVPVTSPPTEATAPDDHGLARRQAMSPFEKAVSPITEYPRHQQEISGESLHQMGRGLGQLYEGAFGSGLAGDTGKFAAGLGNVGFGALSYTFSPLSSLYRSIVGQPVEDVTGIPREGTELVAQLATPGIGFTRFAPGAGKVPATRFTPEMPLALDPGEIPRGPAIRPVDVEQPMTAEAAQRLMEYNPNVSVPRAIVGSPTEQQRGQQISNTPYAGVPLIETARTKLPKQLEETRNMVAAEYGAGDPTNVATRVGSTLQEQAAAEKAAAEAEAAAANAKARANWEATNQAREAAIVGTEQQAAQRAQQSSAASQAAVGPEQSALDMGAFNINRTRTAHDAAETRKNRLYETARDIPAWIADRANALLYHTVERTLEGANMHPRNIAADSAARGMLDEIERFSEAARARQGVAPAGQSMQEIDQLRQNLNFLYRRAGNDADKAASRRIIDTLDDWLVTATRDHLMPGSDPAALPATLEARAANRKWRNDFGYNAEPGDHAGQLINKIVRGEADEFTGEAGVARALTRGDDQSALLHRRLMTATGNDPEVAQSIRSGTWHSLTHDAKTGDPLSPEAVRKNVISYLEGKGRATAERVFTPEQRTLMRAHADTVVESAAQQEAAAAQRALAVREAKTTKPKDIKAEPGDMQKLVKDVIGGKDSGEAIFETLHGYAREGGDRVKLAQVISKLPQELRGDLGGAFIRGLGKSPTTQQFSLDHFANQWANITPQAKKILFGDGRHVQALDDIATVARQLRSVQSKFGNISGTVQNSLGPLILSALGGSTGVGILTHPKSTLAAAGIGVGTAVAGRKFANLLNSPAGASSISKYAQAVARAERNNSPIYQAAVKASQRNMVNTARGITTAMNK